MKKLFCTGIVSCCMLVAANVYSEGFYVGSDYARLTVNSSDPSLDAVLLTGGFQVNNWLSLEGRFGKSSKEKDDGASLEIDAMFGAYAKLSGRNEISPVSPYLVLGYTRAKFELIDDGDDLGNTVSDVSYGLGVDFKVNDSLFIGVEGMQYFDKNDDKLTGYSIGIDYKF